MADHTYFDEVEHEAGELAARIRAGCISMPDPAPLTLFDDVYVETPSHLTDQRDGFGAYLDSFEEVSHS
jgi:pyruvate dehydrogenase E1 component alpha subunit